MIVSLWGFEMKDLGLKLRFIGLKLCLNFQKILDCTIIMFYINMLITIPK
jgi:hypothetical protein